MIIYKQDFTIFFKNITYDECIYSGGEKVNIKKNSHESKVLEVYFNLYSLSRFIDEKTDEFTNYPKEFDYLSQRADWLKNWNMIKKKQSFANIFQVIDETKIKNDKLDKLNKRIERYFTYYGIISSEIESEQKYEKLFNTLTQMPAELYNFIKANKTEENSKFMKNEYTTTNKRTSSDYEEDSSFCFAA